MPEYSFTFPKPLTTESLLPNISHNSNGNTCPLGIDGLLPHPSLKPWTSLVSSTPPPCIDGLQRHPNAPEPFYPFFNPTSYPENHSPGSSSLSGPTKDRHISMLRSGSSRLTASDDLTPSIQAGQDSDESFLDMYWDDEDVLDVSRSAVSYSDIPNHFDRQDTSELDDPSSPLSTSSKLSSTSSQSSEDSSNTSDAGSSFFYKFFPMFTVSPKPSPCPEQKAPICEASGSSFLPRLSSSRFSDLGGALSGIRSYFAGPHRHPITSS